MISQTISLDHLKEIKQELSIWDEVLRAEIYTPEPADTADVTFAGIPLIATLEITACPGHDASNLKKRIEANFGLRCVSNYPSILGPCFSFVAVTNIKENAK